MYLLGGMWLTGTKQKETFSKPFKSNSTLFCNFFSHFEINRRQDHAATISADAIVFGYMSLPAMQPL
jgi:hypothetical protein